jgi:protein TonB
VTALLDRRSRFHEPRQIPLVLTALLHVVAALLAILAAQSGAKSPVIAKAIAVRIVGGGGAPAMPVLPAAPKPAPKPKVAPYLETPATPPPPVPRAKSTPELPREDPSKLALPKTKPEKAKPPRATAAPAAHPAPEPTPREEEPEAPLPERQSGLPTGFRTLESSGSGVGFASDAPALDELFEFPVYLQQMLGAISRNWYRPEANTRGCTVYYRIGRDGRILEYVVELSSGLPHFDRAAIRSIVGAAPFAPLPADFTEASLGVHLRFQ